MVVLTVVWTGVSAFAVTAIADSRTVTHKVLMWSVLFFISLELL